jgi:hypothetical protein
MADLHIDDFRKDLAVVLIRLFNNFPRPHAIYLDEICPESETDEYGLVSKRYLAAMATLIWMGEEGMLRYQSVLPNEGIDQAVLTLGAWKHLMSLNEPSGQQGVKRIDRLRNALKSRSSTQLEAAVDEWLASWNR